MNEKAREFFTAMALEENLTEESVKINKGNNHSQEDAEFLLQYLTKESSVLDLASGTGLLINKIYPHIKRVVAVELFEEFTQFIEQAPNVTVVHDDIMTFTSEEQFDLVTFFGIMNYLSIEEAYNVYDKYYHNVKPQGKIIIKQQFGVHEDVHVRTRVGDNKKEYYSQYRTIATESELLRNIGYHDIEVVDIYPPCYNRWDNTHFYALIAHV